MAVSFICGGTRRKTPDCRKSQTNVITLCCIEYISPLAGFELTRLVVIDIDSQRKGINEKRSYLNISKQRIQMSTNISVSAKSTKIDTNEIKSRNHSIRNEVRKPQYTKLSQETTVYEIKSGNNSIRN